MTILTTMINVSLLRDLLAGPKTLGTPAPGLNITPIMVSRQDDDDHGDKNDDDGHDNDDDGDYYDDDHGYDDGE